MIIEKSRKGPKPRLVEERFWEKVDKSGGPDACWPWQAYRRPDGYGKFGVGSRTNRTQKVVRAHVLSWELENDRKIPDGLQVMHSCNNPPCCNPAHLSVGTTQEDADYKVACGRQSKAKGVLHGQAKLTDDDVREIIRLRKTGWSNLDLAGRYNIDASVTSRICNRKAWPHVS